MNESENIMLIDIYHDKNSFLMVREFILCLSILLEI